MVENAPKGGSDSGSEMGEGAQHMMKHLTQMLEQLEAVQGGQDPEARAMMEQLRSQLLGAEVAASNPAPLPPQANGGAEATELELASQLDTLEGQLDSLQQKLHNAPQETKELLGQSAALWKGGSEKKLVEGPLTPNQRRAVIALRKVCHY
eukprot:CAMPEP_0177785794 /NCGR_PEP_ID=MMETSP0491_2-20121128/20550_1 /TAXON_ID=63592 /ORGANISM="Tetraselmis chuii, Strain PLY429" /LENGTH=150 /DNA_ID=CAMNT_0019306903 /DNA_START=152 /DNA_END=604 /DNA_ORIENTATION=+